MSTSYPIDLDPIQALPSCTWINGRAQEVAGTVNSGRRGSDTHRNRCGMVRGAQEYCTGWHKDEVPVKVRGFAITLGGNQEDLLFVSTCCRPKAHFC